MARPRKTVSELKLSGQYREDRHGSRGVRGSGSAPKRPKGLSAAQRKLWDSIVASLPGVIVEADAMMLRALVDWWAVWHRIHEDLQQETDRDVRYKLSIESSIAFKQVSAIAAKFGLTPLDRGRLDVPRNDDPGNELDTFFDVVG